MPTNLDAFRAAGNPMFNENKFKTCTRAASLAAITQKLEVVELDESWVRRTHAIVIRSYDGLQAAGQRLVDHLRRASA
jgi:hypothetical protein